MKGMSKLRKTSRLIPPDPYKMNLDIPRTNQVTFGTKSLMDQKFETLYLPTLSLPKIFKGFRK